jgi:hypothetical protein
MQNILNAKMKILGDSNLAPGTWSGLMMKISDLSF